MLSFKQMRSLAPKITKKEHKQLTPKQVDLLVEEFFGDNEDQSRLASALTLADEIEWLALNKPSQIDTVVVPLRECAMREWYDSTPMQEAIIQKVRASLKD
jgi:hypothetical protein